jgi:SWI/SNF-related matrix-associated actin-dependent regulator 1 of chromatin subfamily A
MDFGVRYCSPKESIYGIDWGGSSNTRELHLILEKSLMIRRLKSEVLQELPAKRRQKVQVPIDRGMAVKISQMLNKVKRFEAKLEDDF